MIILWFGAIANIPTGFVLCDGNNGSPDLRNQFITGAGDAYAVDESGGNDSQVHTFSEDSHRHNIGAGYNIADAPNHWLTTEKGYPVGTTDSSDNRPQYYALAFIYKT